jgi:hypothetical protein
MKTFHFRERKAEVKSNIMDYQNIKENFDGFKEKLLYHQDLIFINQIKTESSKGLYSWCELF